MRGAGDKVTSDIIRKYIQHQRSHEEGPKQLPFKF
ncbi:MAG: hypothetical protein HY549_11445 [Elusimicrobia bacterium]|nr:hypothetical protein [Elusimicrobiota bacterium]